jgi:hypothetical protein
MNKYILIALSGLFALSSCRKNVYEPAPAGDWQYRAVYQPDKMIDTFSNIHGIQYGIKDGDDIVFSFSMERGTNNEVWDDEYYASVRFPVPAEGTSFSYTDAELAERHCYYSGGGAWSGYGSEALDRGTISGRKNADGSWEISIDVTLDQEDPAINSSRVVSKNTYSEGDF